MSKITLQKLQQLKDTNEKIVMLTAYDASLAKQCALAGVDIILVGDSLGSVVLGYATTVPVTLQQMIYHTQAVSAHAGDCLVLGDLPFASYHTTEQALHSAAALLQAGAAMVKLEGGAWVAETVSALTTRGIPVCGHLGLTPQSVHALSGHKVQGRDEAAAERILTDAKILQQAGAALLVLECVPARLAQLISEQLRIPTIGIGAGAACDGQVLVSYDMLGLAPGRPYKFAKDFLTGFDDGIKGALTRFVSEVKAGVFPSAEQSF